MLLRAVLTLAMATPAAALEIVTELPAGSQVVDVRAEATCLSRAPKEARCLPADWLLRADAGRPLSFHALRWLLGTVRLDGSGTVAVLGEGEDALAAAALIHLAGQENVVIFRGETGHGPGAPRSFSRETVFKAPVRISALEVGSGRDLYAGLVAYARKGRAVALPPIELAE